jgi:hypothetical protein
MTLPSITIINSKFVAVRLDTLMGNVHVLHNVHNLNLQLLKNQVINGYNFVITANQLTTLQQLLIYGDYCGASKYCTDLANAVVYREEVAVVSSSYFDFSNLKYFFYGTLYVGCTCVVLFGIYKV